MNIYFNATIKSLGYLSNLNYIPSKIFLIIFLKILKIVINIIEIYKIFKCDFLLWIYYYLLSQFQSEKFEKFKYF